MVGAFVFCLGISLNITLVSTLQLPKLPAYALVVASQAVIGFLSSRYFVFDGRDRCVVKTGIGYFTLFTLFRLADWTLYSITVKWWGVPYLAAQVANNFLFFLAKFVTYRMLFEGADDPSRPEMTTS